MLSSSLEKPRHVLSVSQFSPEFIDMLFQIIDRNMVLIRKHGSVAGRYVGLHMDITFYEPSTRTRKSFEVAGFNYGMSVSVTENASQFSSAVKGESLEDTIRVIAGYDPICIVLRHPERGAAKQAAMVSNVPIINGGDGDGEHPTQALLDLYTIHREIGRLDGLNIMAVGDNRYGRTIHSLIKLLSHYPGTSITCVRLMSST
ncbi:hypothetical protein KBC99_02820 [Candidatus Saccharibacteria bacterium]|nr:hypothetical protein [Candidatus Saccharibacteria bacterium]